jgi:hypothetical protein
MLAFLVQNVVFGDSTPEGFWFRRATFGSKRLFGARPDQGNLEPKVEGKK